MDTAQYLKGVSIERWKALNEMDHVSFKFYISTKWEAKMARYRKIAIISPGLIVVQKAFCWTYFRGAYFSEGLIIGGNFCI